MRRLPVIVVIAALAAVLLPFSDVLAADPVLVGAADIASCSRSQDTATAKLVGSISGTVFTAGDNVYTHGSASEFTNCYGSTWGQYKSRTRPAPGDEDYETAGAKGYLGYFGSRAAPSGKTYYSYSIGAWHAVVLDTDCSDVGGCGSTSPQANWLRADLAANPTTCTIAIFHHPRFSSGQSKPDGRSVTFWQILYTYGADVIVSGHRHQYERFAPQTSTGAASSKGIREFVVGTGGAGLVGFSTVAPNSQVRNSSTYGVLKLTLHSSGYDFAFVPIAGQSFRDSGSANCHGKP
ncbi:MAG: metallophosphoesterase family protein [Chloroflexota bacterium]